MKRRIRWALLLGIVAALSVGVTGAAASHVYVNDFEEPGDDTAARGWTFGPPPVRTQSGYVSPTGYASGVQSAHGRWHGRLKTLIEPCVNCVGPSNNLGTISGPGTFRPYVTEVDIYLDVAWTQTPTRADRRFDWSSAINDTAGNHRRDFVFNVGTDGLLVDGYQPGFFVNASTNATRGGAFPQNLCPNPATPPNGCRAPVHITQSGWYTFRHRFRSCTILNTSYLAVDFTILRHNAVVANWTICAAALTDTISTTGGDRYGWFAINEINDLAIDCLVRRPPGFGHPPLGAPCSFDVEDECPDDDEDNDGLTNEREVLLLTLVSTADSDFDGIRDGDDDSNGNGEDDEDEDDDEDECPNDSDNDGEDDEDEDDDDGDDDDD